jgi:hypothetical protein
VHDLALATRAARKSRPDDGALRAGPVGFPQDRQLRILSARPRLLKYLAVDLTQRQTQRYRRQRHGGIETPVRS